MGSCIICGADVDGWVCSSHEEDVCFEFTGSSPDQLTSGRYYRGSVDGFADFGVFIDIGEHITGLLHTSELNQRLESLDWEPGDTVYVQVKNVRENGNIDLGWSIRQHESEFRGKIIDDPEGDRLPDDEEVSTVEPEPDPGASAEPEPEPATVATTTRGAAATSASEPSSPGGVATETQLQRAEIDALSEHVGAPVRIEGEITDVRQTSGPTIIELHDETGTVECAAFESAGVRAYPEATVGDIVRIDGEVEERRGDIQVETTALEVLEGDDRGAVVDRIEAAIAERAEPPSTELLADDDAVTAVEDTVVTAATAIRRAVFESRPVVIRHNATVDGYVAGAALERAILPLIRQEHEEADAEYHYVDRRPLDGRIYGMSDAMRDTTEMLDARERHDEKVPLFVLVNAGSTEESRDGFDLLETYGAERVVIDGDYPDEAMVDSCTAFISPHLADDAEVRGPPTSVLAANLGVFVNPDARSDLSHLPAVSYARSPPTAYAELAADAGYDGDAVETLREAIALKAFYQSYGDKRELIADLLFGDRGLAEHASEQFKERVAEEIRTAEPHLDTREVDGRSLGVLDLDAFTHQYDFPPATILLGELAEGTGLDAVVGLAEDALYVWSPAVIDMRTVGERTAEAVPDGGVETVAGRDGHLRFLVGRREAVMSAAVDAIAEQL